MICAQVVGTRCASTKFALSVYFCGAATANGEELNTWNGWAGGLEALRETLESMRMISRKGGVHPAFVYELSLGQRERSDPALISAYQVSSNQVFTLPNATPPLRPPISPRRPVRSRVTSVPGP